MGLVRWVHPTDESPMPILGPTPMAVVEVTGADRLTYLEAVTSQHVTDLAAGEVRGAMYLDAHGAPLAIFDVVGEPDRVLLLVPDAELADEVVRVLGGRTFLSDATFARIDLEVEALRGGVDGAVGDALGAPVVGRTTRAGDVLVVGRPDGADLVAAPDALAGLATRLAHLGVEQVDPERIEAGRIAAGEPDWGREVTAPHLPEELGLLPTHVHLAKGCYPGQEAVARMWMLGRPRRRLAHVDVGAGVSAGAELGAGKERVTVTAVADVPEGRRGLAFVPGTAEPGQRFGAGDGTVTVRGFVGDDRAVVGHDPAVTRRRDRR